MTKKALRNGVDPEQLAFRLRASTADVEWRLSTRVLVVDLAGRTVTLDDGAGGREQLAYDGLVVATGVRSSGSCSTDRHPGATRSAPSRTRKGSAFASPRGAGRGGRRRLHRLRGRGERHRPGCRVTVVEPLGSALEGAVGPVVGAEVQRRHEEHGVRFEPGLTVAAIEGCADGPTSVVLHDGRHLPARVVVEAVGSVPHTDWLDGQGFDLSNGVRCDVNLHPLGPSGPVADVVALGDVARFPVPLYGGQAPRIEHWNMPGDSAGHAARSLLRALTGNAPEGPVFDPLPSFWTDQYGVRIQFFGLPSHGIDDVRVLEGDLQDEAVGGYHREGALVGLLLGGMQRRMMPHRARLIEELGSLHVEEVAS